MTSRSIKSSTGDVLAHRVAWARSPFDRIRGLIGTGRLERGRGLIITPAKQVHTFGIDGPIDVVFCSEHWVVVHVVSPMPTGRFSRWVRRARHVIELPAYAARDVRPGDQLSVTDSAR